MKSNPAAAAKTTLAVKGTSVAVLSHNEGDYLCITDIARYKDAERTDHVLQNWLRNRNIVEFLGVWEQINNPDFKPLEFEGFKSQAGLNSFVLTARQWIDATKLLVLANLESLNAELIEMGLPQAERLQKLNAAAIRQVRLLAGNVDVRRLEGAQHRHSPSQ